MSSRKSPDDRTNREKPVYSDMSITWDGVTRGPELPQGYQWCDFTKRWWQMIRNSAQAMSFHDTDWYHMIETAFLHNRLFSTRTELDNDGNPVRIGVKPTEASTLAGEIRRRTEAYGFTWADRRKYGIHVVTDEDVKNAAEQATRGAARTSTDYRKRLNGLA